MKITLEFGIRPRGINSLSTETDFSTYTLRQLFEARYWIDAKGDSNRGRHLEKEIEKRCAYIRERIHGKPSASAEPGTRFRPYGFIVGLVFLSCATGPFVAFTFLDWISVFRDVSGDHLTLSGVWALVTLPIAVPAFMIGGIMDAGRVVKWFDLAGRQGIQPNSGTELPGETQTPRDALFDIPRAGLFKRYSSWFEPTHKPSRG